MNRFSLLLLIVCFSSASLSAQINMLDEISNNPSIEYATPVLPEASPRSGSTLFEELDQSFDLYTTVFSNLKGFNAAMLVPDSLIWKRASGVAQELPDTVELTTEHLMGMASVSKTFVATTILLMYEDGLLSLDDTIGMYLDPSYPNIPFHATIRNLLSHRTGINDYLNENPAMIPLIFTYPDSIWEVDSILFNHVLPPNFPVDESWSYSNTNYLLAGKIIENITGNPWYEEVRERILVPLGLVHTFAYPFESPDGQPFSHCWADIPFTGEVKDLQGSGTSMDAFFSAANSAGCLISTPEDIAYFIDALFSGEILQPATLDEMQVNYSTNPGIIYGLGAISYPSFAQENWGHDGNLIYKSWALYFPEEDVTLVVQQNDNRVGPGFTDLFTVFNSLLQTYLTYSPPVSVEDVEDGSSLQVYPNPATDHLIIDVSNNAPLHEPTLGTLMNMNGQIVQSFILQEANTQVEVGNLPAGIYVLKVLGANVKVVVQ